jgi:hypothetical protein
MHVVCLESPTVPGALQLRLVAKAYGPSLSHGDWVNRDKSDNDKMRLRLLIASFYLVDRELWHRLPGISSFRPAWWFPSDDI